MVYVLWYSNFNGDDVLVGIFRTDESAQKLKETYGPYDQRSFRVEPYQLDD